MRILIAIATAALIAAAMTRVGAHEAPRSAVADPDASSLEQAYRDFDNGLYVRAADALERWLAEHPDDVDARVKLGWCRYRNPAAAGSFEAARKSFEEALRRAPDSLDARIGLAYVTLQTRRPADAAEAFREVLELEPDNGDALRGLALAGARDGAPADVARAAVEAARRLLDDGRGDDTIAIALVSADRASGGPGEVRLRADAAADARLEFRARTGVDRLEVRGPAGTWSPLFVKGVNLGAALPGRFPTEFPYDEATWRQWIETIAGLGANAVRAYTLLPPAFYRILSEHNAAVPDTRKLWLLQGVWTELPPRHDFSDPGYVDELRAEIARVVDAVHGDLILAPRPGHAFGVYDADVSRHTLAWVVGREWEPFAVADFDAAHPGPCSWTGRWVASEDGGAMECWVAQILEFAADHEARRFRAARPLTFANWPTLDPLPHPTESNRVEEEAWRKRLGRPWIDRFRDAVWDNDAVSLDATKIRATPAFPAGVFASYHIYPNYPDFLNNDATYAGARDRVGPSRYAGYLRELKAYHGTQPVLVAEFGMSTSRGIAHVQPEGWHHGGHDEREAMGIVARLLASIADERMAGGIVFAFQDEWFKGTWSVAPFEIPPDSRRLWFNAESPEQSYGLVAHRPDAPVRVDGDPSDWPEDALLAEGPGEGGGGWLRLRSLSALADEGYLYLLVRTEGGPEPPDWGATAFVLAVDTYDADRGETRLRPTVRAKVPTGVEFLVSLAGPSRSAVLVTPPYDAMWGRDGAPVASPRKPTRSFRPMMFETNRERIARDGTPIPAISIERGRLRFGSLDPDAPDFDTRTDVAIGAAAGTIELRIPWGLLNISDPSTHRVLHQPEPHDGTLGAVETDGFRIYAFATNASGRATSRLPMPGAPRAWLWPGWTQPRYRSGLKHGIELLREAFRAVDAPVSDGGTGEGRTPGGRSGS